jgi:hypothetical protein
MWSWAPKRAVKIHAIRAELERIAHVSSSERTSKRGVADPCVRTRRPESDPRPTPSSVPCSGLRACRDGEPVAGRRTSLAIGSRIPPPLGSRAVISGGTRRRRGRGHLQAPRRVPDRDVGIAVLGRPGDHRHRRRPDVRRPSVRRGAGPARVSCRTDRRLLRSGRRRRGVGGCAPLDGPGGGSARARARQPGPHVPRRDRAPAPTAATAHRRRLRPDAAAVGRQVGRGGGRHAGRGSADPAGGRDLPGRAARRRQRDRASRPDGGRGPGGGERGPSGAASPSVVLLRYRTAATDRPGSGGTKRPSPSASGSTSATARRSAERRSWAGSRAPSPSTRSLGRPSTPSSAPSFPG